MIHSDPGSFRDPSGSVFYQDGKVYRSVDASTFNLIQKLADDGLLDSLANDGFIVKTRMVAAGSSEHQKLLAELPGAAGFLQHEQVPFISYPYEWPVSMLADAAELQLLLQLKLIAAGYSLKDASVYNIQFMNGRPVFIDIPSIEIPQRLDVWIAYGQFCRMHLFPLMLAKHRNVDTRGYYLTHVDGMDVESVRRVLGRINSLRPSLLVDVAMQAALQKQGERRPNRLSAQNSCRQGKGDAQVQEINLKRLVKKVQGLRPPDPASPRLRKASHPTHRRQGYGGQAARRPEMPRGNIAGDWSRYTEVNSYTEEADRAKRDFVKRVMDVEKPGTVLDLGCNTGEYSLIAAEAGSRVVSVDSDHDCVDALYQRNVPGILPLSIDIANPSPAIGFRNQERSSFLDRAHPDCVMALALMHHLVVTSRIPLPQLSEFMAALTGKWLIIECVPVEDEMFQQLLVLRENIYGHLSIQYFSEVFSKHFNVRQSEELPESARTLFLMEKK